MLFSSLIFLFFFLPITIGLYFGLGRSTQQKNRILLLLSALFFAWGGPIHFLLFVVSVLINYFLALKINAQMRKQSWLIAGVVVNLSILILFKYVDFLIGNWNLFASVFNWNQLDYWGLALPLGISFYTFHQLSMLIDMYRSPQIRKIRFTENALYVAFFPQLIAGPIVRYKDIIDQIQQRKENFTLFRSGIDRFVIGLSKKVILANSMGKIADLLFAYSASDLTTDAAWVAIIAYTLQVYFDFSGYSDMAIGLGRMFGFQLPENFNLPYLATTIQDFWRRWHISLSSWFRDYVYIPLGGNRVSASRTYVNLIIIFLLTGFWHGASWTFVVWGIWHGIFILVERAGLRSILDRMPKIIGWMYTLMVVLIGWVFFRVETFSEGFEFVKKLFTPSTDFAAVNSTYVLNTETIFLGAISILLSLNAGLSLVKNQERLLLKWWEGSNYLRSAIVVFLFLYAVMVINSGSYNPFIYFHF
jgi:alginate O-acetyltransferase complex protein AlgI